jgi:hypothetical protein
MSERHFRIILGLWLIIGLYLDMTVITYALITLLLFEGATNLRVPLLISKARFGDMNYYQDKITSSSRLPFEAERALRFIVVLLILLPLVYGMEFFWWMPWFVGFALIGAGLSGMCPMVLTLRRIGFS